LPHGGVCKISCFIGIFIIKKIYRFTDEIQKGKGYIEEHWQEKYDAKKVAAAANLSAGHFSQLFKKHMGMSPRDYHILVIVRKIQERLKDETLTVAEAFAACGIDYSGHFSKVFREKTGLSPGEYRKTVRQGQGQEF
jgi:transcriptional regulator GlxA family with amidase domain